VTLTATAAAGWHFDRWEGALVGSTNPATLLMDGNKAVTAVFVQDQYTLGLTVTGQGSVNLSPAGGTYLSGTTVTLTATASAGWPSTLGKRARRLDKPGDTADGCQQGRDGRLRADQYTLGVTVAGQGSVDLSPAGARISPGRA